MVMTDPVADCLTRIRNACRAKHKRVDIPASKIKVEIARILQENHFIQNYKVLDDGKQGILRVYLKYVDEKPVVHGIERTREQAETAAEVARAALAPLAGRPDTAVLLETLEFVVDRIH